MTVFQYIERFKKTNSTYTYGDLMSGNSKSMFENSLSGVEKQEYERLRNTDRQRLMVNEQINKEIKPNQQRTVNIGGIGEITQVC